MDELTRVLWEYASSYRLEAFYGREGQEALRKERGMTQEQTAQALSITLRNYQRIEADGNTPNYINLVRLADFFDVSMDYLGLRSMSRMCAPLSMESSRTKDSSGVLRRFRARPSSRRR